MNLFEEKLKKESQIYERLGDDISRKIFEIRINYYANRNEQQFLHEISTIPLNYWHNDFEEFMHSFNHKKIIIFGAGYEGERSKFILSQIGYGDRVVAFADNNPQNWGGGNLEGSTDYFYK